jgi:uncharacterized membrane protein YbhN (UPF0104 family)
VLRSPHAALTLSLLVAGGTVAAVAASERPGALWRGIQEMQPLWLLAALGAEFVAYVGYVLAYRATISGPGRPPLDLMLAVRLVVAGFGPFVPLGGFSFDRRALAAVHRNHREARRQVLALGVVEYLLLAPAACVCALILLLQTRHASLELTLPWVFAVPPGFALAWWATRPDRVRRMERSRTSAGRALGEVLHGAAILREVVHRPLERPWALIGMALYWAGDIACFAFALNCFNVEIGVPALVVAYATGYAASRRSLPLGGAGITEALLTLALVWVHVDPAPALLSVAAYRLVNLLAPVPVGLLAHAALGEVIGGGGEGGGGQRPPARAGASR